MTEEEIKNNDSSLVDIEKTTPMFRQFLEVKRKCKEIVLLYRMGDFYEGFFEDAIFLSRVLGLTLTHKDGGEIGKVPMAGLPVKSLDMYIPKLVDSNYKVAICEQLEDPKTAKGLVKRDIVRTITAGTLTESTLLEPSLNNWLAAVIQDKNIFGLAYTDISTGEFKITKGNLGEILSELARIKPVEILTPIKKQKILPFQIVPDEKIDLPEEITEHYPCTKMSVSSFNITRAEEGIKELFNVVSLEGFGFDEYKEALPAAGAIIDYIAETQKGVFPKFDVIKPYSLSDYVSIDANTRRNLEITETSRDKSKYGSLFWAVDRVKTPCGSRLLKSRLNQPLKNKETIQKRLDAVEELVFDPENTMYISSLLEKISDIERIAVRLSNKTINPRDFLALRNTLLLFPQLEEVFQNFKSEDIKGFGVNVKELYELGEIIERTIDENAPATVKDGNVIKPGVNSELDYFRDLLNNSEEKTREYEAQQRELTGIKNLKVGYNNNFGYFIEVSKSNLKSVPVTYVRKQTLLNVERFMTPELKKHENDVISAKFRSVEIEQKLYSDFTEYAQVYTDEIKNAAHFLANVDVLCSFAQVAREGGYVKPEITDGSELYIKDGRHPVLEKILPMGKYVPNDINLKAASDNPDDMRFMILTGPNMAGKSTYMRQNALILLLAQAGSFVPASYAKIGIADKIFTRVGAVDDLSLGQSTFMVEMNETAHILNSATEKSLIILDEIGRGTSTYDGVAIAWSVAEYIAKKIKARTIFATHYHELNVMANSIEHIKNYRITVDEEEGMIRFLRKVVPGSASKSYGIHVAQMAGLPDSVISRAQTLMNRMQKDYSKDLSSKKAKAGIPEVPQLTLAFEKKEQ